MMRDGSFARMGSSPHGRGTSEAEPLTSRPEGAEPDAEAVRRRAHHPGRYPGGSCPPIQEALSNERRNIGDDQRHVRREVGCVDGEIAEGG